MLAACGDDPAGEGALGAVTPAGVTGEVSWALPQRPAHLDPLFARTPAELLVSRQIHEPLVAELSGPFDEARRLPGLALSAQPSSDQTVWRVRLRPGVSFGDGAPFNASAVLANVARWQQSATGRELIGGALADAPRPDMVRFILPASDPDFDRNLSSARLGIVSPRAIDAADGGEVDPAAAGDSGTGPFELRVRTPSRLLLARDTGWWGDARGLGPGIDQLEFVVAPQTNERLGLLREGTVQVVSALPRSLLARVRRDPLLAVIPGPGGGLAVERSIRGISPGDPAPALNGVWRTGIAAD